MQKLSRPCAPRNRCRQFRTCTTCAAIRQAKIADVAESIFQGKMDLQLIVIRPTDQLKGKLSKAIQHCIRANDLTSGIWTVEKGPKTGLIHGNILTINQPIDQHKTYTTHAEQVRTNARCVAAYISKKSQIPREDEYHGRTYAAWGHISRAIQAAAQPAVIQAAATEYLLQSAARLLPEPYNNRHQVTTPSLTKEEYCAIAKRHLPILTAISDQLKRR